MHLIYMTDYISVIYDKYDRVQRFSRVASEQIMSAYVTVDSLETIGDRRMYLSTTSMCAGYTAECLLSLGRYKTGNDPSSLSPWIEECKRFIDDFVSTLERKSEAPYAML